MVTINMVNLKLLQPKTTNIYAIVKNDIFVAKICKYALYESSEGLFCAPRKPANFCHPDARQKKGLMKPLANNFGAVCQQPALGGALALPDQFASIYSVFPFLFCKSFGIAVGQACNALLWYCIYADYREWLSVWCAEHNESSTGWVSFAELI